MKYLGIDFGRKRVGIAISEESGRMAFPHSVLNNDHSLLEQIKTIMEKFQVTTVVLGESKNLDGSPNPIMSEITEFKKKLEEKIELSVILEPEFWTSAQAKRLQGENDLHDASAASLILQSYLDKLTA